LISSRIMSSSGGHRIGEEEASSETLDPAMKGGGCA
jgi:hypothetical protein